MVFLFSPCALLNSSFSHNAVGIEAFSAVVLPAVWSQLVVCKVIHQFGLVAATAVFGFHASSMISLASSSMARDVLIDILLARLSTSAMNCSRST